MTDVLRVDPAKPDEELIARAAECLRAGGLVAFPTETVYGLGAHALDTPAVLRLFAAKERPANDPLIVHTATIEEAMPLVEEMPRVARDLAAQFWPGPLTMVLKRSAQVPDVVTAGLDTVAVRVPVHPIARALLERARIPIAAPSANLFSRPSPTRAAHVIADLADRIDIVLDGGATNVGVESTVIDLSGAVPTILRPGAIDLEALQQLLPGVTTSRAAAGTGAMPSPGMLAKHYSPKTPLHLYRGDREAALDRMGRDARQRKAGGESVVVLAYTEDVSHVREFGVRVVECGAEADAAAVAARLYAALRECDELGAAVIFARTITTPHPLSAAIEDRLRRAAASLIPDP